MPHINVSNFGIKDLHNLHEELSRHHADVALDISYRQHNIYYMGWKR